MAGSRKGIPNKVGFNINAYWREKVSPEVIDLAHTKLLEMLNSDDPANVKWAIDHLARRFTVSAEKTIDREIEYGRRIENKEQFNAMFNKLKEIEEKAAAEYETPTQLTAASDGTKSLDE